MGKARQEKFIYVPVKWGRSPYGGIFLDFFERVLKFMSAILGGVASKDFSYSLHLFEDERLLWVNTERGSRLHANEHVTASECVSRTFPAQKLTKSDLVAPSSFIFRGFFKPCFESFRVDFPLKGKISPANAPGVNEEFSGHGGGGLFLAGLSADPVENLSGLGRTANGDPGGLLEHPSEKRRAHFRDMSVPDGLAGLGNSRGESCVATDFTCAVKAKYVGCFGW